MAGKFMYRINPHCSEDNLDKIVKIKVIEVLAFENEIMYADDSGNDFVAADIGKTVFLTYKEAELALSARKS